MHIKKWWKGSFTVEAALVVPFSFLVLMSLSCLFQALIQQNDTQFYLLKATKAYSSQGGSGTLVQNLWDRRVFLSREIAGGKMYYTYETIEIPILGSRFFRMNRYQQMVASDYRGVSMVSEETNEKIVYVAVNGQVYHLDRECTYLRTRVRTVMVGQAAALRNQSGGKYYPCESCCQGKEPAAGTQVYITSFGDRYHTGKNCPRIKRTVRQLPLSEVGGLPACSKCGGE